MASVARDVDSLFDLSLSDLLNIKVSTASREDELLQDTPVAVTVITSKMIANSGASSIKRLLTTYVPGFTAIEDQNEINVAARGIYTSGQQKILFMVNGHRLNARSYSSASPDASLSLDKIDQIEVLRGPASALYGNVALTAVVNIILKQGKDNSGSFAKVNVGNYGQQTQSFLYGAGSADQDMLVWLNHYKANGETRRFSQANTYNIVPSETNQAILGSSNLSHYDVGLNYQIGEFEMLLMARKGGYVSPFTDGGISGETYVYDQYPSYKGMGPGSSYEQQDIRFAYGLIGNAGWRHQLTASLSSHAFKAFVLSNPDTQSSFLGAWRDTSLELMNVSSGPWLGGKAQLGLAIDAYEVYESKGLLGSGNQFTTDIGKILNEGGESITSLFVQHKKELSQYWLSNIGVRYDYKNRYGSSDVEAVSPRIAFVYKEGPYSVKMSAAQSFVDASFFNRRITLSTFRGADDLKPERLTTYQVSPSYDFNDYVGQYNATIFYNVADDFVRRDLAAPITENNYSNAGSLDSWGIEQEAWWLLQDWEIRANMTYQEVTRYEDFEVDGGNIANVPYLTANLITEYEIHSNWSTSNTIQYISEQFSPVFIQNNGVAQVDPFPNQGVSFNDPDNYVAEAILLHTQLSYKPIRSLRIDLQVDNLLDEDHMQGGTVLHPYPQTGRWYRLAASYKW